MAHEHLKQADLFLPEERWGDLELESSSNPWLVLLVGVAAIAACVLMVGGKGAALTWWGAGLFVVSLGAYTSLVMHGIARQNEMAKKVLEGEESSGGRTGDEDG